MWTDRERHTLTGIGSAVLAALSLVLWLRPSEGRSDPPGQAATLGWDEALARARQIDVNSAGPDELARLPGIGPRLAQRIVAHRHAHGPFRAPEELVAVRGIGPKTLETVRPYVAVTPEE